MNTFYEHPQTLPYYTTLVDIRRVLAEKLTEPDVGIIFPRACCNASVRVVQKILCLEEVGGWYSPNGSRNNSGREAHAWNYDSEKKLYIDVGYIDGILKLVHQSSTPIHS